MDSSQNSKISNTSSLTATFAFDNNSSILPSYQNAQTSANTWSHTASLSSLPFSQGTANPTSQLSSTTSTSPASQSNQNTIAYEQELAKNLSQMHAFYMQRENEFLKKSTEVQNDLIARIDSVINEKSQEINTKIAAIDNAITQKTDSSIAKIKEEQEISLAQLNGSIKDSESKLQDIRNSVLSTLALFASFFTFISISINIFTHSNVIESIGLLIVLWSCLFTFSYTFFAFLHAKKFSFSMIIAPFAAFLIALLSLIWVSNTQDKKSSLDQNNDKNNSQVEKTKTESNDDKNKPQQAEKTNK